MLNILHGRPRFDRGHIPPHRGRVMALVAGMALLAIVAAIILAAVLFLTGPAKATLVTYPVAKRGQCPGNYSQSGGYCLPMQNAPICVVKVGQCPASFYQSGGYCCRGFRP